MDPPLIRGVSTSERRTPERLYAHYVVERALADRLRLADKAERAQLYGEVYDELYRSVPDHPQLTSKQEPAARTAAVARTHARLSRFLTRSSTFLEIGPGDLALATQIAQSVARVIAVDVSAEITKHGVLPPNLELVLSDGSSIPVREGSVDVAYSDQLMEHLHPDDALDQLRNLVRALRPGGRYICLTPSGISGPHDISMYFSEEPTGFHLKEYTTTELERMLRSAGFTRVAVLVPVGERFVVVPVRMSTILEALMRRLPRRAARSLARLSVVSALLGRVVATR